MFGLFKNPAREGRQLARDARVIIETERESSSMDRLNAIAEELDSQWQRVKERIEARPADRKVIMYDLRQINAAARRSDQRKFTAVTLTMIAYRADELGEHGTDALDQIHEFIRHPGIDSNSINA